MKTIVAGLGILFNNMTTPEQARNAVARLRTWRRVMIWVLVVLVPLALVALWLPAPGHDLGPVPLFILATGGALVAVMHSAERRHLAMAIADQPLPDAAPMTLTWRFGIAARTGIACVATALITAYLVTMWIHGPGLIFDLPITLLWAWLLYDALVRVAWRPLSRAPHIADIDADCLRVLPLGLTVPWDQISGVFLQPDGVRWVLADPKAFVAALPIRAGRRRALRRWLKRRLGAIIITDRQMREAPTTVQAMSVRLRYEATGLGATPGSGDM